MSLAHRVLPLLALCLVAADAREVGSRPGAHAQRPLWSPDGSQLSWEANYHQDKRVELLVGSTRTWQFEAVQPAARQLSDLTAGFGRATPQAVVIHELSWAPTEVGRHAYSAARTEGDFDIFVQGGGALASSPFAEGSPRWSPDGRKLLFTSARTGQGDVYLLDLASLQAAPRRLSTGEHSAELDPRWSPTGERIVWVGPTSQGDAVWISDLQGQARPLLAWEDSQVRPSFSPEGRLLAFYSDRERSEGWDLWVTEIDRPERARRLARDVVPNAHGPSWTPDGQRIVLVRNDDAAFDPIAIVPVDGSTAPRTLQAGTVSHGDLDVGRGPDGRTWIAYVAQGRVVDSERSFHRLFVTPLP